MTTPFILIFCLLMATCVIAYWSDNLGKKLGKKRISLFGLRPRQTATLISMVSSVGIMLFTLIVLLVFSSNVRDALLYYDTVRADLNQAQIQNAAAKKRLANATSQMAVLGDKVINTNDDLKAARRQVERTRALINATQQQLQSAQSRLSGARARLAVAEKSRDTARGAQKRAQSAAAVARSSEVKAREAEKRATERYRTAENRYAQAQDLYSQAQNNLTNARLGLTKKTRELQAISDTLNEKTANLKKVKTSLDETKSRLAATETNLNSTGRDLNATQKEFVATQKELIAQKFEIARLNAEQDTLQQQVTQLNLNVTAAAAQIQLAQRILTEPIVIEARTIFAAAIVPSRLTVAQAADALHNLVRQARAAIQNLKPPRSLEIFAPLNNGEAVLNEEEAIEQLAIYLNQFAVPVSVRVIAARDHIQADTVVKARLEVVPVRTIYQRGDTIAETKVDGQNNDALIFRALLRLTDEGATQARRLGAAPLSKPPDEPFFAEGTNERIFETIRRIDKLDKTVTVRLIADDDISTVEPVKVRFEIVDSDSA